MNDEPATQRDDAVTQLFALATQPGDTRGFVKNFEAALIRDRHRRTFAIVATSVAMLLAAFYAAPVIASAAVALANAIIHGTFGVGYVAIVVGSIFALLAPALWLVRTGPWLR